MRKQSKARLLGYATALALGHPRLSRHGGAAPVGRRRHPRSRHMVHTPGWTMWRIVLDVTFLP